MNTTLARARASEVDTDCLILLESKGARRPDLQPALAALYDSGEITGKQSQFTLLHGVSGFKARRILVAGVGKKEKADAAVLRKVTALAREWLWSLVQQTSARNPKIRPS